MIKLIEADGWAKVAQHCLKKGRVTVPGHPGDDLTAGLEKIIRSQAQLKKEN
jgi:predicted RNA binding protein YcfA (HicA-like mRNA interferase family)